MSIRASVSNSYDEASVDLLQCSHREQIRIKWNTLLTVGKEAGTGRVVAALHSTPPVRALGTITPCIHTWAKSPSIPGSLVWKILVSMNNLRGMLFSWQNMTCTSHLNAIIHGIA